MGKESALLIFLFIFKNLRIFLGGRNGIFLKRINTRSEEKIDKLPSGRKGKPLSRNRRFSDSKLGGFLF